MKLGILGGAFDPIHYGHLETGKEALEKLNLEEVWFMPCYQHVFNKRIEDFSHRYKMVELALDCIGEKRMKVSDYEGKRKGISYTIDTVKNLLKENPDFEIYWIMGTDVIETFDKWERTDKLVKLAKLVIVTRNGKRPSIVPENSIVLDDLKISDESSTEIKRLLREGNSIEGLTPKPVIEYIKEHKLYSDMK